MSKAVKMARVSAKGGFHLFWGLAASTVISAVGVILVARLLSPPEYGIVTIALTASNLRLNFSSTKFAPELRKRRKQLRTPL